jgi:hypothetical protein
MWTAPQIEPKSPSSQLTTLSKQRPIRRGNGENTIGGYGREERGKARKGKGDLRNPDVTRHNLAFI